jgi:Protein of unknown function (DUF2537)
MTVQDAGLQLRAVGERAVLVGHDGRAEREVDPGNLALDGELAEALHEWARVASAVQRAATGGSAAGAVVSHRGRQLAGRLAAAMGRPVGYVDPVTGDVTVIEPPEEVPTEGPPARRPAAASALPEPVPWLTGLTVSAFVFVLVLFAMLTLANTLAATNSLLAIASNVVVTAGLLPSVWLVRHTPIWRWIALGVAGAIGIAWLALPFMVL